jgi:hypothetical protein
MIEKVTDNKTDNQIGKFNCLEKVKTKYAEIVMIIAWVKLKNLAQQYIFINDTEIVK